MAVCMFELGNIFIQFIQCLQACFVLFCPFFFVVRAWHNIKISVSIGLRTVFFTNAVMVYHWLLGKGDSESAKTS